MLQENKGVKGRDNKKCINEKTDKKIKNGSSSPII
jgi:hypothetical protein